MRGIPEVPEVDEPYEDAYDRDDLRKHVSKIIQLTLQRSLFANLRRDGFVNVADGCVLTSEDNDCARTPTHDRCALDIMDLRMRVTDHLQEENPP